MAHIMFPVCPFLFDRGSEHVISHGLRHPKLPGNINDSEFGPKNKVHVPDKARFIDLRKDLVQHRA